MTKKYLIVASALLVFFMFVSASSASPLLSKGKIYYEKLSANSIFKKIVDRLHLSTSNIESNMLTDTEKDDSEDYEENHIEVDNSENNVTIYENETTQNTTIITVDENIGLTNETVSKKEVNTGIALIERFVDVIIENKGKLGTILQRVIERVYAPGTIAVNGTTANKIVDNVVVISDGSQQ